MSIPFLEDLVARRRPITTSGNPIRFVEFVGGSDILYSWYMPDAETTREPYWYDTRNNILYRQFRVTGPSDDVISFYWRQVSECK